jgi:hypothetical protein
MRRTNSSLVWGSVPARETFQGDEPQDIGQQGVDGADDRVIGEACGPQDPIDRLAQPQSVGSQARLLQREGNHGGMDGRAGARRARAASGQRIQSTRDPGSGHYPAVCHRHRARRCHGHAPARSPLHVDAAPETPDVRPLRRRRRPTGAPPPLPRTFPLSSAGWLLATLALVAVIAVTFAASRHAVAPAITAADGRVVQWFAGPRSRGSPV